MKIKKAGKQTKAFWRSEKRFEALWQKEPIDYATLQAMLRGHAAGWMDGVAWERKQYDDAEVVAFDGQTRTITLRFDLMPCAAIGELWLVRTTNGI